MKTLCCGILAAAFCAVLASSSLAETRHSSDAYAQARGFLGTAHCRITGATGTAQASTAKKALGAAIAQCIANGGVPACCRKGSSASPQ